MECGHRQPSVDMWLNEEGFYRKVIARDESCIYRAVSEQIYYTQVFHKYIRSECVYFAQKHSKEFQEYGGDIEWEDYLKNLAQHLCVGGLEMKIISKRFKRDIIVFDSQNFTHSNITNNNYENKICLCSTIDGAYYDSVYTTTYMEMTGFCQSLVYTLLYEQVFEFSNVEDVAKQMLSITYHNKIKNSGNKFGICVRDQKPKPKDFAPLFPYRVAKAIDPNQYRNIEYDVWLQIKKDFLMNNWYLGGEDLKVGTKCLYRTDEDLSECYIQKILSQNRNCEVFIINTGQRKIVPRGDLQPLPNSEAWPLPYCLSKGKSRISNKKGISMPRKSKTAKDQEKKSKSPEEHATDDVERMAAQRGSYVVLTQERQMSSSGSTSTTTRMQYNYLDTNASMIYSNEPCGSSFTGVQLPTQECYGKPPSYYMTPYSFGQMQTCMPSADVASNINQAIIVPHFSVHPHGNDLPFHGDSDNFIPANS